MKISRLIFVALVLFSVTKSWSQTYTLTVNNGYGSGNFQAGDTVHIWSIEYDTLHAFSYWSGDSSCILNPHEWHSKLIMPAANVSVTANISTIPTYTLHYEQLMGKNNWKNVYYFFPLLLKGVLYLYHGTGGSAKNWTVFSEYRSFVNAAIKENYGVIITEAEEITLQSDLNSDGKLRWQVFPMDTANAVDYQNIIIITDSLINRGYFSHSTPLYSVGMSNGGSYSAASSYALQLVAGVSYCASSAAGLFTARNNPFAFRMAKFDNNPQVGPSGNHQAQQEDSTLAVRGICHDYLIHDKQPLYPERFARISGISVTTSQAIFNQLKSHNQIDVTNFAITADSIKSHVLANPSLYPSIVIQVPFVQADILNEIAASNAEHQFYSDFNFATLDFFNKLCGTSGIIENSIIAAEISLYPNPTNERVFIKGLQGDETITVMDFSGKLLEKVVSNNQIDLSNLADGLYFVIIQNGKQTKSFKVVKS